MIDHEPEDLERAPDGIPHAVVGLTAFYAVLLAGLIVLAWTTAHVLVVLAAAVVPIIVCGNAFSNSVIPAISRKPCNCASATMSVSPTRTRLSALTAFARMAT